MQPHVREEPKIAAAAEKQMRTWSRIDEISDRMLAIDGAEPAAKAVGPYVALSREAGAGGGLIAELIGQKLGWTVLGRSLLDRVSERYRIARPMLDLVDETKSNWALDVLGTWLDSHVVSHEKYVAHLRRVVLSAARTGRVVFVGRGAQFFLPRGEGLSIRIVAPEAYRAHNLAARRGIDETTARRMIRDVDEGRRAFIERYFHHDVADPHLYDVVINVEHRGPQQTAEAIIRLCADWLD
ncbi:MAG: cytidylate kinase-like family protein [Pirellulales bacterium]|nr:cytidylate kinase-like family protein [Pirellulales bacterium]